MKLINKLFDIINFDGCKHIIVSTILTTLFNILLPIWITIILVVVLGLIKEYYDKYSGKGQYQIKDILCNIFGIILGLL